MLFCLQRYITDESHIYRQAADSKHHTHYALYYGIGDVWTSATRHYPHQGRYANHEDEQSQKVSYNMIAILFHFPLLC